MIMSTQKPDHDRSIPISHHQLACGPRTERELPTVVSKLCMSWPCHPLLTRVLSVSACSLCLSAVLSARCPCPGALRLPSRRPGTLPPQPARSPAPGSARSPPPQKAHPTPSPLGLPSCSLSHPCLLFPDTNSDRDYIMCSVCTHCVTAPGECTGRKGRGTF